MEHDWEAFGELVRVERARRRISQQEVARHLGVSHTTISRWERGLGRLPTREQARSLEHLFALERGTVALLTGNLPAELPEVEWDAHGWLLLRFAATAAGRPEVQWDADGSLVLRFTTVAAQNAPGSLSGDTGLYLSSAAAA